MVVMHITICSFPWFWKICIYTFVLICYANSSTNSFRNVLQYHYYLLPTLGTHHFHHVIGMIHEKLSLCCAFVTFALYAHVCMQQICNFMTQKANIPHSKILICSRTTKICMRTKIWNDDMADEICIWKYLRALAYCFCNILFWNHFN